MNFPRSSIYWFVSNVVRVFSSLITRIKKPVRNCLTEHFHRVCLFGGTNLRRSPRGPLINQILPNKSQSLSLSRTFCSWMEAIRKQATKLREQVARQQQVLSLLISMHLSKFYDSFYIHYKTLIWSMRVLVFVDPLESLSREFWIFFPLSIYGVISVG